MDQFYGYIKSEPGLDANYDYSSQQYNQPPSYQNYPDIKQEKDYYESAPVVDINGK